jgi:hypothetical protein
MEDETGWRHWRRMRDALAPMERSGGSRASSTTHNCLACSRHLESWSFGLDPATFSITPPSTSSIARDG